MLLTDGREGEGDKKAPLHKICHSYPTMMKLGTTVISYLKKIHKIYKSCDTLTGNEELLLYQEIQI